jgi:hypothetical protein
MPSARAILRISLNPLIKMKEKIKEMINKGMQIIMIFLSFFGFEKLSIEAVKHPKEKANIK